MRVKFICLNVWLGGKLFDPLIEFLRKENADILALQEVFRREGSNEGRKFRLLDILREEFGYEYSFYSPALIDITEEGRFENGNAVLSKYPVIEKETIFFDIPFQERNYRDLGGDFTKTPRNLQHAAIDIGETRLNIFNTQGIWGFDGEDNGRRLKMSETIVRSVKDKENVILAGDFNIEPHTKTILNIEQHLENIFKGELRSTFNMKQKTRPGFANWVVDMAFVSPGLKVADHYCPQVDISDHLPLICVLEI